MECQVELNKSIQSTEAEIDNSSVVERELADLRSQMEEKKARIEKIKSDIRASAFEEKDSEATNKIKRMEEQRDALNTELRKLSLQADERAKLSSKRTDLKEKEQEVKSM